QPDPFYRRQGLVPPEQAAAAVGALPLAAADWNARLPFYLYCRQNGFWPREVGGKDPGEDPAWFSQFCPAQNVTRSYPPTLLIHGDQDTDVPYEQSVQMAAALQQHGVEHELMIL